MKKTILFIAVLFSIVFLWGQTTPIADFYHDYDEIVDKIFAWQEQYPDTVMVQLIGHSQEDEMPIYAVKVSSNVHTNEDKPSILVIGQVHAEEIIGIEIVMKHIEKLLTRRFATPERHWLSQLELWFIPTLNPEGHQVVTDALDTSYRKNKRDNNNNGIFDYIPGIGQDFDGVDLNRNFDFNWVHGDTLGHGSGHELYDYYRGPYPHSESEVQALIDLYEQENFVYSIIFHSSRTGNLSEKVFFPFNWAGARPSPDIDIATHIGHSVASKIRRYGSPGYYEPSPSAGRNGCAHDFAYMAYGNIQLLIECATSNLQPDDEEQMIEIVAENIKGAEWLFSRALTGGYVDVSSNAMLTGIVKDASTGQPIVAEVIVEERNARFLRPRLTDEDYGRYWRPLTAGIYTVTFKKKGYETRTFENVAVNNSNWRTLNCNMQPLPEATFTGTVLLENIPVSAEIVLSNNIDDDIIEVNDGIFSFDTFSGAKNIVVTTEGAYPYIGTITLVAGLNDIVINLSEENIVFQEDWESTTCLWVVDGPWQIISENSHSGNAMTDSWGGGKNFYNPGVDVSLTTPFPISLFSYIPPYYQTPYLVFWQHLYTEWDYDFVYVQGSVDGEEWTTLYQNSGKFDYWHPVYVSLEEFVGEEFYLRFRLTSDSNSDRRLTDPGWTIDSIKITAGNSSLTNIDQAMLNPATPKVLLNQNYPNPFNPETTIAFAINNTDYEKAEIRIYNIKGALVEKFVLTQDDINNKKISWNAQNNSSGIYFYQLVLDGAPIQTKKAVMLK